MLWKAWIGKCGLLSLSCLGIVCYTKLNLYDQQKLFFLLGFSLAIITIPDMPYVAKGNAFSFPFGCWLGLNNSTVTDKIGKLLRCRLKIIFVFLTSLVLLAGLSFWLAKTLKFQSYQTIISIAVLSLIISSAYLIYLYVIKKIDSQFL